MIHIAIERELPVMIEGLLQWGANVNQNDANGVPPIFYAVFEGVKYCVIIYSLQDLDIVKLLVDHDVNLNVVAELHIDDLKSPSITSHLSFSGDVTAFARKLQEVFIVRTVNKNYLQIGPKAKIFRN